MALLTCLLCLLVVIVGGLVGRYWTLGYARAGEFAKAKTALRWNALAVGALGMLIVCLTLGWPWTEKASSDVPAREFSPLLLFPLLIIGLACYGLQFPLVHFLWRFPMERGTPQEPSAQVRKLEK